MTIGSNELSFSLADAGRAQLQAWSKLSTRTKIEFFEEMIELAYFSGALSPQRLALRDATSSEKRREE